MGWRSHNSCILLAAAAELLVGAGASAQTFTGVGAVPLGSASVLYGSGGVSGDGTVVVGESGEPFMFSHAFRWTRAGGIEDLGVPPGGASSTATATNVDGSVVVGKYVLGTSTRSFRWTREGGMQDLGGVAGGSSASGVSGDGTVIVGTLYLGTAYHAFRWTQAEGAVDLGTLPGQTTSSAAGASFDGSVIAGWSGPFAIRWTAATGMVNLGMLPGDGSSLANGVSSDGLTVVGQSFDTVQAIETGVRWTANGGISSLGVVSATVAQQACAASASGFAVVGRALTSSNQYHPYRWTQTCGLVDLTNYLAAHGANLTGWSLGTAFGVSNDGATIVGSGMHNNRTEVWVATVSPDCRANCDCSHTAPVLNVTDFVCFLNKFAAGDPYANCDESTVSPVLNVLDFTCFLNKFAAGCP